MRQHPDADLLKALAGCWQSIQTRHPETPPVTLVVGQDVSYRTRTRLLGCYRPSAWSPVVTISEQAAELRDELESAYEREDLSAVLHLRAKLMMIELNQLVVDSYRTRSEVVITDDALRDGGAAVVNVLVHEAVHAVAERHSIDETSRRDHRYHNGQFKTLGQQMGLVGVNATNIMAGARCGSAKMPGHTSTTTSPPSMQGSPSRQPKISSPLAGCCSTAPVTRCFALPDGP